MFGKKKNADADAIENSNVSDTNEAANETDDDRSDDDLKSEKQFTFKDTLRLYVTGIITGMLIIALVNIIFDIFDFHPFSRFTAADRIYDRSQEVEAYIDKFYWKSDTSDEQFAESAAKGMVAALDDPFSVYLTKNELENSEKKHKGDYVGIGCTIGADPKKEHRYILSITEGKPADKAGLKENDEIIAIDGNPVKGKDIDYMIDKIAEKTGVTYKFTVLRDGKQLDFDVTTENIVNQSVKYKMIENNIGYISVSNFDGESSKQFKSAVDALDKRKAKALIIDLRNNGGGIMSASLDMLDRLLPAGQLITETRKGYKDTIYKSTNKEKYDNPIVLLVNPGTASASEIFAGCLQDRASSKLVGEKTYGKGIVQTLFHISEKRGDGIKLTTGQYLLPSGRSINDKGLTPDYEVKFTGKESDYETKKDNQLQKAIEILS